MKIIDAATQTWPELVPELVEAREAVGIGDLGGILSAVLAETGVIMWWRAHIWKTELAAR